MLQTGQMLPGHVVQEEEGDRVVQEEEGDNVVQKEAVGHEVQEVGVGRGDLRVEHGGTVEIQTEGRHEQGSHDDAPSSL